MMRRPIRGRAAALALALLSAAALAAAATVVGRQSARARRPHPIRAAFYYPWYPQAWRQHGVSPYTRYKPALGFYSSRNARVIRKHIRAMRYAGLDAAISSWWGRRDPSARAFKRILTVSAAASKDFRWSVYYEPEGQGDPGVAHLRRDLRFVRARYARRRSYLKIRKRFVVFVYADPGDGCAMAGHWRRANNVGAYVVLKVFPGYRHCRAQPNGWHQYAAAAPDDRQSGYSYSISPGFWKADEAAPRLPRDLERWRRSARAMVASHARFQLVTTFNEWGEGTAVENASEWNSPSAYGAYLDVLHKVLRRGKPGPQRGTATLLAAGDIASCGSTGDEAIARLLDHLDGTIAALGDTAYESGSAHEFAACYAPSWGRHKGRTRPAVGNHEYLTPGAAGYFNYFGAAAGARTKGYYSYGLGSWHIVVLNANCSPVSCSAGSPQLQWLRADLASHRSVCTLAYWHQPRFSSGHHGDDSSYDAFWQALYRARADVILNGHDHDYERFRPLAPSGKIDRERGIVEFVVGTGGKSHRQFSRPQPPTSAVRDDDTFGVLRLKLRRGGYRWRFIPEAGKTFSDSGSASCH